MRKSLKYCKHILEYMLFLTLSFLLRRLSIDCSANLCSMVFRKMGKLLPVTKIARNNILHALGKDAKYEQIINETWDNFGRFVGEFPHLSKLTKEEVQHRIKVSGIENIQHFKQSNQPFLLFTAHLANWDFVLKIVTTLYPKFAIVYRKLNNYYVDNAVNVERSKDNIILIKKGPYGAKALIKAIKSKHSIAMLIDQKMNDGIEVPFFNKPAMTAHAIAKLAIQFKYPIIPCQIVRTKGTNFQIIIWPQLQFEITSDIEHDCYNIMLTINKIVESWIRAHPGQWFWFHRRWK